jgi:hypothetical protein
MKNIMKYSVGLVLSIMIMAGCTTPGTVNNYYGYNNNPQTPPNKDQTYKAGDLDKQEAYIKKSNDWHNPLQEANQGQVNADSNSNVTNNIYLSNSPDQYAGVYGGSMYVPVIVPWWYRYQGWGCSYYSPYTNFSMGFDPYWDWYSPWYNYNPYYGYNWYMNPYAGCYAWYNQPYYSYHRNHVSRERIYRDFGVRRSSYAHISEGSYNNHDYISQSRSYSSSSSRGTGTTNGTYSRSGSGTNTAKSYSRANSANNNSGSSVVRSSNSSSVRSNSSVTNNRGQSYSRTAGSIYRSTQNIPTANTRSSSTYRSNGQSGSSVSPSYSSPTTRSGGQSNEGVSTRSSSSSPSPSSSGTSVRSSGSSPSSSGSSSGSSSRSSGGSSSGSSSSPRGGRR